ncbi:MAG: histidine phosphatase family protein [Anaerolineae bacterium]|nr:histidine phosphatase family protein [Anaerolineae bacterium]
MKMLLVLRHAKSEREDSIDHDRPLAPRGKRDAPRIGRRINEMDLNPHLVVSSDARRARQTARLAAEAFCYDPEDIVFTDRLYSTNIQEHLDVIRNLPDDCDVVMLVGHNPTFEDLVEVLTEEMVALKTAVLAHIILDIESWDEIDEYTGELVGIYYPNSEQDE